MQKQVKSPSKSRLIAGVATVGVMMAGITFASLVPSDAAAHRTSAGSNSAAVPAVHIDRSGRKQVGRASFYADRYAGRLMSDGTPMRLYSNNAASLTLPLGTTARVTNLKTGKSAIVTIRDRGPYVAGRIVDLSPATARQIGLTAKQGLAQVEVAPLKIPLANGTVKDMSAPVLMAANY